MTPSPDAQALDVQAIKARVQNRIKLGIISATAAEVDLAQMFDAYEALGRENAELREGEAAYKETFRADALQIDALTAALAEAKAAQEKAERWSELCTRGKSPCGHWKAYAHTEDGGKNIDCWQCHAERSDAALAEARKALETIRDCERPDGAAYILSVHRIATDALKARQP